MAPRRQDPFEGLRLDERFVREARFIEPSAAERTAPSGPRRARRCQVVPAPRGLPGIFHRLVSPPSPVSARQRLARLVAALTLAVGMVGLTFVALRHGGGRGVPAAAEPAVVSESTTVLANATTAGTTADVARAATGDESAGAVGDAIPDGVVDGGTARDATAATPSVDPFTGAVDGFGLTPALLRMLRPGDCLAWTPAAGSVAPSRVDCAAPHVDEVTRIVDVADRFDAWPGPITLRATAREDCAGAMREFVGGRDFVGGLDVAPHYVVGSLIPDRASWERGARQIVCTIRSDDLAARKGAFALAGSVRS